MAPSQSVLVIPARGGSQRIPGKNTRALSGVPVLERAIAIARGSGTADHIFVSTDSQEIAELARQSGVQVIDRPLDLADNHTGLLPVMQHAIDELTKFGLADTSTTIGCLYATAVTLDPSDLASGLCLLTDQPDSARAFFVVGVCAYSHPIQRALELDKNSTLTPISPEFSSTRTQDLSERYFDAGAFIWGYRAAWDKPEPVLSRAMGYPLPAWRSVDLDTEEDWKRAELVVGLLEKQHE